MKPFPISESDALAQNPPAPIWLFRVCQRNGLILSQKQLDLLSQYVNLLLEWNKAVNLISRKDEENVWQNHVLHSLSVLFKISIPQGARVLDLGTGGGLPGIPLRIARPDLSFTLLDATKKKVDAVADIVFQLGLTNVSTVWGRAEDIIRQPGMKGSHHLCIARAVAPLQELIRWARPPLVSSSSPEEVGYVSRSPSDQERAAIPPALIALKGGELEEEIRKATRDKAVRSVDVISLTFNGSERISANDKKVVYVQF